VLDVAEFRDAVDSFRDAVRQHDEDAQRRELDRMRSEFVDAPVDELYDAAPILADVLGSVPAGLDALVGVVIGGCVEYGADPASCAEPILFRAQLAVEQAVEFCHRWPVDERGDYPEPVGEEAPSRLYAALGGLEDPSTRAAVLGWWSIPTWTPAVAAVLGSKEIRKVVLPRPEFLAVARQVLEFSGAAKFLARALAVLDDEDLVVLHRASREGFEFTMSGIADNFQLQTLLAERLVTPGHLPGEPPTPDAVAACLGQSPGAPRDYDGHAAFALVTAEGAPIWHEGAPIDIPVVEGTRLLVLDPPASEQGWSAARAFAAMPAELVLDRRLSEAGVRHWLSHVSPPVDPSPSTSAGSESPRRHWWQRRGEAQTL
jgi:hypothetical protein